MSIVPRNAITWAKTLPADWTIADKAPSKEYYQYCGDGKGVTVINDPSTGEFEVTHIYDNDDRTVPQPPALIQPVGDRTPELAPQPLCYRGPKSPQNHELRLLKDAKASIDKVVLELMSKDGGPEDMNQCPGRVLCEKVQLPYSEYRMVSGPARLTFDPKTGSIIEFAIDSPEIMDVVEVQKKGQGLEYSVKSWDHQFYMVIDESGQEHFSTSRASLPDKKNYHEKITGLELKRNGLERNLRQYQEALEVLEWQKKPWLAKTPPPHPSSFAHQQSARNSEEDILKQRDFWLQQLRPVYDELDKLRALNHHVRPLEGIVVE